MSHPDPQTRVGSHSVFSMVLMPSLLCPWLDQNLETSQAVSRFSSIGTTQTVRNGSFSIQDEGKDATKPPNVGLRDEVIQISDVGFKQSGIDPPRDQSYNFKYALTDGKTV